MTEPEIRHERFKSRGVLVYASNAPPDAIESLRTDPDALLADGGMLKDGDRCTVVRIAASGGSFVLKRYNLKGSLHTAMHWFLRSRARWSWLNGGRLLRAGLPTPLPVAMFEEVRFGARSRSYLLTEFVEGMSLDRFLRDVAGDRTRLESVADRMGEIWRRLGELRLGHGDMKATNFIIDSNRQPWLIDLDGMRCHSLGPALARARRRDLARFLRNWSGLPEVEAAFRARMHTNASRGE